MSFGIGGKHQSSTSESGGQSWILDDVKGFWGNAINEIASGGADTGPGYVGMNQQQQDALAALGLGGDAAKYWSGQLSGQGTAQRRADFEAMQKSTTDVAKSELAGTLTEIGSNANLNNSIASSRTGLAEGVATGAAQAKLQNQLAQQGAAYTQYEDSIRQGAANNLTSAAQGAFKAGSALQQDEMNKMLDEYAKTHSQTDVGKLEAIMQFVGGLSGLGGSSWGSSTGSGFGWNAGFGGNKQGG